MSSKKTGTKRKRESDSDHVIKTPRFKKNLNKKLTDILSQLEVIERNRGETYRAKAYRQAVQSLSHADFEGEEAKHLKGVGKKIAAKIDEIIQSGHLLKLDNELKDEKTIAINELTRVTGIGPKFAKQLYADGVKTIDDLRKRTEILNNHQQIGLKYFEEFEKKIPRAEMQLWEKLLTREIHKIDRNIIIYIVGSYRRGLEKSSDIDILLTQPKTSSKAKEEYTVLERVIEALKKSGFITDTLGLGKKKFMGVVRLPDHIKEFKPHLHRRLDVRFICADQFYPALLHYTGSDFFNNQMRSLAIEKGYHISEYAVQKKSKDGKLGPPLPVKCEKDIFDYIGMPYLKPEERSL